MRAKDGEEQDLEGLLRFFRGYELVKIDPEEKPGNYWEIEAPVNYQTPLVRKVEKYGFWISETQNEEGGGSIYEG